MTGLFFKLDDDFDRDDGQLIGYDVGTIGNHLNPQKHYDLRAFHSMDFSIPLTILDMQFYNVYHFSGQTMQQLSSQTEIGGRTFRSRLISEVDSIGAQTTLAGSITSSTNPITIASPTGFPSASNYLISIDDEQMLVTAGQGTTSWTVTRGVNGTSAASHGAGELVEWTNLEGMSMQYLDHVITDLGNEEWPSGIVEKDPSLRYADVLSTPIAVGAPVTLTSYYDDDIITDFNDGTYYIELVLRDFPSQSDSVYLDLDNSYIDFSSDSSGNYDPTQTDSISFSSSLNDLAGGGDTFFRINRDILTNADLSSLLHIRLRLVAAGTGTMTFKAQALRLLVDNYVYRVVDTDTKYGELRRSVPRSGGADSDVPLGPLLFNQTRPKNITCYIKFNSGHNPSGNDNIISVITRHVPVPIFDIADDTYGVGTYGESDYGAGISNRIVFTLTSRDTQSRLSIIEVIDGDSSIIYQTPINTNILTEETDYLMVVDLIDDQARASIYEWEGAFLPDAYYTTGWQGINYIGRGFVGLDFQPYNYDFSIDYIRPTYTSFALITSTPFPSVTPVQALSIYTNASPSANIASDLSFVPIGDASVVSNEVIGIPPPSYVVIRAGNEWSGGITSTTELRIIDPTNLSITGNILPINQVLGLFRIALVDQNGMTGYIGHLQNPLANQWNSFSLQIANSIVPGSYRLIVQNTGYRSSQDDPLYPYTFYINNLQALQTTVGWEASTDGENYYSFGPTTNDYYNGIEFPNPAPFFQVRGIAFSDTAWIEGYEAVPHYGFSGHV